MFEMISTRIVLSMVVVIFLVKSINCSEDNQNQAKEVEVTKSDSSKKNNLKLVNDEDEEKNTVREVKLAAEKGKEGMNETPVQGAPNQGFFNRILSLSVRDVIKSPMSLTRLFAGHIPISSSDNEQAFCNAWSSVMEPVQKQLLCTWHIL